MRTTPPIRSNFLIIADQHYNKTRSNIADLTREIAINAAAISSERKIAMADSIILATTRAYDATLWTQDTDFYGIDGVQYIEKSVS